VPRATLAIHNPSLELGAAHIETTRCCATISPGASASGCMGQLGVGLLQGPHIAEIRVLVMLFVELGLTKHNVRHLLSVRMPLRMGI
jgi:hypothetical protein